VAGEGEKMSYDYPSPKIIKHPILDYIANWFSLFDSITLILTLDQVCFQIETKWYKSRWYGKAKDRK